MSRLKIVSETHLRGNVKSYAIKHRSKKLGLQTLSLNSIGENAATTKAWADLSKQYKALKKVRKQKIQA